MMIHGNVRTSVTPTEAAGELTFVSWVPEGNVPKAHRQYVRRLVDKLAAHNALGRIEVRWFDGKGGDDGLSVVSAGAGQMLLGVSPADRPNAIALNAGLRGNRVVAHTIAHEMRHVVQRRRGWAMTPEQREADADAYASWFVQTGRP